MKDEQLGQVDEFKNSEKTLEKFGDTLFPKSEDKHSSFPNLVIYDVRFDITENSGLCSDNKFKNVLETIFNKMDREKFDLALENQKFNQPCLDINQILGMEGYFL